jgi:hypothetical protein
MYEQLPPQNEKKQEHNQQLYDIISRMPETPALPNAKTKRWRSTANFFKVYAGSFEP